MAKKDSTVQREDRVLNLDAFISAPKTLTFRGVDYEVIDPPMEVFLRAMDLQEKMTDDSMATIFDAMLDMVGVMVPDMPKELIRQMTRDQLMQTVQFIIHDITGVDVSKNLMTPTGIEEA